MNICVYINEAVCGYICVCVCVCVCVRARNHISHRVCLCVCVCTRERLRQFELKKSAKYTLNTQT